MELDIVWSLTFDHLTYRSFRFSLDSTYTYRRRRHSPYHDGQRHSTYLVPTTTHRMRTMAARISRRVGPRLLASVNPSTWTHNYLLNHSHKQTRQLEFEFENGHNKRTFTKNKPGREEERGEETLQLDIETRVFLFLFSLSLRLLFFVVLFWVSH